MSVIVVVQNTMQDPDKFATYAEKAGPTIGSSGAKILANDENPEVIEGSVLNKRTVIIEFASKEAFNTWYNSPEYQEALPLRLEAAPGSLILVNKFEG